MQIEMPWDIEPRQYELTLHQFDVLDNVFWPYKLQQMGATHDTTWGDLMYLRGEGLLKLFQDDNKVMMELTPAGRSMMQRFFYNWN